ncbi:MAG: hypothetical protein HY791_07115 [Deltaproteobacteria bacterium]|nr:hypothetical protein [Deltaproteobacteria bacterium]
MRIGEVKNFVESRLARGLSEKDVRDLTKLVANDDGAVGARGADQLKKIAKEYGDRFTTAGARTLEDLTGIHVKKRSDAGSSSGVVGIQTHDSIPSDWHRYTVSGAVAAFKKNEEAENTLYYRASGGDLIPLEVKNYSDLVKSGAITLYKNPKEDQVETDDDGGWEWSTSLIMVPNTKGEFAAVTQQLDKLAKSGIKISKDWDDAQEKFHSAIHASNFNGLIPDTQRPNWGKAKAEAKQARPAFEAAIEKTEAAVAKWNEGAEAIRKSEGSKKLGGLVDNLLESGKPNLDPVGIDLGHGKEILKAQDLFFDRKELLSIDPGFSGIRVQVDALAHIEDGGTLVGYADEMNKQLAAAMPGVKSIIEVEDANREGAVIEAMLDKFVAPLVGKTHIDDYGYAIGGDSPLSIQLSPELAKKAKTVLAEMKDFLIRAGREEEGKKLKVTSND